MKNKLDKQIEELIKYLGISGESEKRVVENHMMIAYLIGRNDILKELLIKE